MFKLLISWSKQVRDYSRYVVWNSVQIQEQLNIPATCTFTLMPADGKFEPPPERAYVNILSVKYQKSLFTGFVSSRPVRVYTALSPTPMAPGGQIFQYQVSCTSDEYLLNIKSVPFIPAFVNRYQGDILATIANVLCPNFFDTTQLQKGDLVPYFTYDPKQSWSEIGKTFADATRFRLKARNKALVYCPYADQPLGIAYDEKLGQGTFDPSGLNTQLMNLPTINDVTIIGQAEAGNNHEDYFIGDGFTGNFPLHHQTFQGSSVLLLQETWNGGTLNLQNWYLLDPTDNFDFSDNALNVNTNSVLTLGSSYLSMNNGIEVAGSLDLEHGEVTFNDFCQGVIGGIYTDSTYSNMLAGFRITSPEEIVQPPEIPGTGTQGIGVGGVHIQAEVLGKLIGNVIVTQTNHDYVLQTVLTAPKYTRYDQIYRTVEGEEYGGKVDTVNASVTFVVQDYSILDVNLNYFYQPKVYKIAQLEIELPAFVAYALINNERLNVTVTGTTVASMPMGALLCLTNPSGLYMPSGLILPSMLMPSGNNPALGGEQFIGVVQPYAGAGSGNIYPQPLPLIDPATQEVLGIGLELQAAQVTAGNETDTLAFYNVTIPSAGTHIRFQSWESQAAVSRLQDKDSIAAEVDIVGDDGLRMATVTDLDPLPRTSEDADNAALAFLQDRGSVLYQGTYTCTSLFFNGQTGDWQFYPTCGRYLNVNAPRRGIDAEKYLVTQLQLNIIEEVSEILQWQIGFGADLHLEKVIKPFIDIQPSGVLTPKDKANPPNPRYTINVDNSYLDDLNNVQVDYHAITTDQITVSVYDQWGGPIEVRYLDGNWLKTQGSDYVGRFVAPSFTLQRTQYDQTWYMRPVDATNGITSRRTKVIRVMYPRRPSKPLVFGVTAVQEPSGPNQAMIQTYTVQFGFNGDRRNIYGFELRAADDWTILVQKPITAALSDLLVDLGQTPLAFMAPPFNTDFEVYAYFFNLQWEYSPALPFDVAKAARQGLPQVWSPGGEAGKTGDCFFLYSTFGLTWFVEAQNDGSSLSSYCIIGCPPANQPSTVVGEPVVLDAQPVYGDANGVLGAATYWVAAVAWDGNPGTAGAPVPFTSPLSDEVSVVTTQENSAIAMTIEPAAGAALMDIYVTGPNDSNAWFYVDSVPAWTTSYQINWIPLWNVGAPDERFDHFLVQYKIEFHAGICGCQIQPGGVTATTLLIGGTNSTTGEVIAFPVNSLAGRVVSALATLPIDNAPQRPVPIANYRIVSNTADTITIGPNDDGEQPPDLTTIFQDGDVVTIRMLPTNVTDNGFEDPMLKNPFAPDGMNPSEEQGRLAWVIDGPGKGQLIPVADNTATGFTLASNWTEKPTNKSTIVIVDHQWQPGYWTQGGMKVANRLSFSTTTANGGAIGQVARPNILNLSGVTWIFEVLTAAVDGSTNYSDPDIPIREAYAWPTLSTNQSDSGIISYASYNTPTRRKPGQRLTVTPAVTMINGVPVVTRLM